MEPKFSWFGLFGFILAIIGIQFDIIMLGADSLLYIIFALLMGGGGLTFSLLARKNEVGKETAKLGMILSIVSLGLWVIAITIALIAAATVASHYSYYY